MSSAGSIGTRLKREREKRNFSVEDVHLRLRIHPGVIQKIENDDLNDWPGGKIYARGFVRQYADFLGVNTAEILSDFDSLGIVERPVELFVGLERKSEGDPAPEAPKVKRPRTEKKKETPAPAASRVPAPAAPDLVRNLPPVTRSSSHPAAKWAVAAMALVVVALAVFQISRTVRTWVERKPSLKLAVMAPVEQKAAAKTAPKSAPVPAAPSTRLTARTRAVPAAAPAAAAASAPASKYLNSPAQGSYPKIRPQDRMMLEIYAITDVWMRIQADGNVVFEAILHRGETERWLADSAFDTKLGRPEGVRIAVNGYPIGQPGTGKIKNLHFTRDGIEEVRS